MKTRSSFFKAMLAAFTLVAVFCSLQFSAPRGSGAIDLLAPLMPATASAEGWLTDKYCHQYPSGFGQCEEWEGSFCFFYVLNGTPQCHQ